MNRRNRKNQIKAIGCVTDSFGTAFAYFKFRFFSILVCIALVAVVLQACVLPADIEERPIDGDSDTEEGVFDYWPIIVNPQPPSGEVMVPIECQIATFKLLFAKTPDPDDFERFSNFETRWYLNRPTNPVPYTSFIGFGYGAPQIVLNPRDLYDTRDETGEYLLEVFVSDLGFNKGYQPIINEGAHTDYMAWIIRFDVDTPVENPEEDCL